MWDFEADLSQTVLDIPCNEGKDGEIEQELSDLSQNNPPIR